MKHQQQAREDAEKLAQSMKMMAVESEQFQRNITRQTSTSQAIAGIQSLTDAILNLQSQMREGLIDEKGMPKAKEQIKELQKNLQIQQNMKQRLAGFDAKNEEIGLEMFRRGLGRETRSDALTGRMQANRDEADAIQMRIDAGMFDWDKDEKKKQLAAIGRLTEEYNYMADTQHNLRKEEEARSASEMLAKQEREQTDEAVKKLQSVGSAMSQPQQADALSAKGWGSVGASITGGMEKLQTDGNNTLKTIQTVVASIANRSGNNVAVFA